MFFLLFPFIICSLSFLSYITDEEKRSSQTQLNKSFSEFIRQTFSFIHGMLNKAAHIYIKQRENEGRIACRWQNNGNWQFKFSLISIQYSFN